MKVLEKYEHEIMEDGNAMLDLIPVEDFEEITVYVAYGDGFYTIFDGGSTANELRMIYNFSSKIFTKKLDEICKEYEISVENEVFYTECDESEFDDRLNKFITALNKICNI